MSTSKFRYYLLRLSQADGMGIYIPVVSWPANLVKQSMEVPGFTDRPGLDSHFMWT